MGYNTSPIVLETIRLHEEEAREKAAKIEALALALEEATSLIRRLVVSSQRLDPVAYWAAEDDAKAWLADIEGNESPTKP